MDPNQYYHAGYTQPAQPYLYNTPVQDPGRRSPHNVPSQYNGDQRVSYMQPSYRKPLNAASPHNFIAELPASPPPAPPTTTPPDQLNEDQLLAQRLQNLEVEEARRRSSSILSQQTSTYSLRDVASLAPQVQQSPLEVPPPLPSRPHSESISSTQFYGPDSFGPPPASFDATTDGRRLMAQPNPGDQPPPTPHVPNLPEVVVPGFRYEPSGLELVSTLSRTSSIPTPSRSSTIMDSVTLASHLEAHREVPYPPQWRLPPVVDTLYGSTIRAPKATDWLDAPAIREWRRVRASQHASTPTDPTYSFTFKMRSAGLLDARLSWKMLPDHWTYDLKFDGMSGLRKSELLTTPSGIDLITTYISAQNYDSLRFIGPDGSVYLWVAHAPLSSLHGARYDTLRHALFMAPKGCDPLYGQIIADHAYWDGVIDYSEVHPVKCAGCGASPINGLCWKCKSCQDHEICEQCRLSNRSVKSTCSFTLSNVPDEALYIRSSTVDPALVCTTLQIMRDWEFHTLRNQKFRDPKGFQLSEDKARQGDLGKLSYWKVGDRNRSNAAAVPKPEIPMTNPKIEKAKAKELEKLEKAREKEKAKEKKRDKKKDKCAPVIGVSELIRGSAQVGGSVGDVGEALRRRSTDDSTRT